LKFKDYIKKKLLFYKYITIDFIQCKRFDRLVDFRIFNND